MDVTSKLEEHNIIGGVLPPGTNIPHNLGVKWPTVNLLSAGERLHRDAVQEQPQVRIHPKPDKASRDGYVLLMVDPDLTHYNDRTFGQVLVNKGTTISPYVGPAPLAAHLIVGEARPSRYTFLLLKHASDTAEPSTLDAASLKAEYEGDLGSLGGEAQHIIDRIGFDTKTLLEKNGLEVVAATFMFAEGNVKSSLANAGLLAPGVAQKAMGK